jgi:fermentation-respiration switch protein FrsA (DUF1100 family)
MIHRTPLFFFSGGALLSGCLYRNTDRWDIRQPAIIVTGSWLTVKEQMAEHYAMRLAERGYASFTFDFTGFGESGGELRQAEIPERKIADLIAAAEFVSTLSVVEPHALTHVAICASAQYGLAAVARGSQVTRLIGVAGWFHDTSSVAAFYGGMDGVTSRLEAARNAMMRYETTRAVDMVPAYRPGDTSAAMFLDLDYYGNSGRGLVPTWTNQMATLSWTYWLLFDGLSSAGRVSVPTLFVHSDGCVFPENIRLVKARLKGPAQLVWTRGTQTDFYDQPTQVAAALDAIDLFLKGGE